MTPARLALAASLLATLCACAPKGPEPEQMIASVEGIYDSGYSATHLTEIAAS